MGVTIGVTWGNITWSNMGVTIGVTCNYRHNMGVTIGSNMGVTIGVTWV